MQKKTTTEHKDQSKLETKHFQKCEKSETVKKLLKTNIVLYTMETLAKIKI